MAGTSSHRESNRENPEESAQEAEDRWVARAYLGPRSGRRSPRSARSWARLGGTIERSGPAPLPTVGSRFVGGAATLPVGWARMPRGSFCRSRVARFGAPFAGIALVSAFLLLPLHGVLAFTPPTASGAPTCADAGTHPAQDPFHDPGDCPQCRALAQGRAALATAAPPQPATHCALAVPSLLVDERVPRGPALTPEQPRAPPLRPTALQS